MPLLLAALALLQAPAPPQVRLEQPGIALTVSTPDAKTGFYRGTRFDHAGVVGPAAVNGHRVFGPWKPSHDPANNDDIVGPAEEFGMSLPLGYGSAKVGEPFLKIGVGLLIKPEEEKYRFHHNYKVKQFAPWDVQRAGMSVSFRQRAALNGYGYEYTKIVELVPGKKAFRIRHSLKNTGSERITTEVYNHNFFNVDGDPVGPNYALAFPGTMNSVEPRQNFAEYLRVADKTLTFAKPLGTASASTGLSGLSGSEYRFTLRHEPSAIKLHVTGTGAPVAKTNFWSVSGCACPEPFVTIDVAPGAVQTWDITYDFGD